MCQFLLRTLVFGIIFAATLAVGQEYSVESGEEYWVLLAFVGGSGLFFLSSCIGVFTSPRRKQKIRFERERFLGQIHEYNQYLRETGKQAINKKEFSYCGQCGREIPAEVEDCPYCSKKLL